MSETPRPLKDDPEGAAAAVERAIREATEAAFVTHFAAVAYVTEESGATYTVLIAPPSQPLWQTHGLLSFEASSASAEPVWHSSDDDD